MTRLQSNEELHEAIREAALKASRMVNSDLSFALILEPGDATRYVLFGVPATNESWYIAYLNNGAYEFPVDNWAHASYVGAKLRIENLHARRVVADFINLFMEAIS